MKQKSVFTFLGVVLLLISCFQLYYNYSGAAPSNSAQLVSGNNKKTQKIRVAATGDIMLHSPQIKSGLQHNGTYDFSSFFKEIKPYLSAADLTIANFEVTLGGKAPYSGYPRFNAPDALVDALRDAGINIVSTANNHALDTGALGVKRTYQILNEKGIHATGTTSSSEKTKSILLMKNGIKLAFLAYTEGTNGLSISEPHLVNKIDMNQISKDIRQSKQQGADFIFVSLHFGDEYKRLPNKYQVKISDQVLRSGADIVLGSHPHVIQPMKKVTMDGKNKFIIYSMGNFISNQSDPHTDEGMILYFDIEKNNTQTELMDVSFVPTLCHKYRGSGKGKSKYVVLPTDSKLPRELPGYPNLTRRKWTQTYNNVSQHVTTNEHFPVFHVK